MRNKSVFSLFSLVFGLAVFGVAYTILGQGPGTEDPNTGVGPVGSVNELFDALLDDDVEQLEQILEGGADPNAFNTDGATALQWAILGSGISPTVYGQVKTLIAHGANPNLADNRGMTALHSAAMHGASEAVMDALLGAGGDPNITTTLAGTPYELALMAGNQGAVAAIERVTDRSPKDRAFLQALGVVTERVKTGWSASTTDQERENVISEALDALKQSGFLTEGDREALVRQLIEQRKLHEDLRKEERGG